MAVTTLPTRTVAATTVPLDIAADVDIQTELLSKPMVQIAVQNASSGRLAFLADVSVQPPVGSRDGLILRYGNVLIYELDRGDRLWLWTSSTLGATVVINGAG